MIDLSSDTVTKPVAAMREAMLQAEVGDEQRGEDPSVNKLLARCCELLGKEAALFLPSGTMCNVVALRAWTRPGDTMLCDPMAHVLRVEGGNPALNSGLLVEVIDRDAAPRGVFEVDALLAALGRTRAAPPVYRSPATLLSLENTHNFGGGTVWPLQQFNAVSEAARAEGLAVHLDGARLFNAAVALDLPVALLAAHADSVWVDFTKGLGAPLGAVLAGSADFIERARRYKHALGGAMRQAGICAAGCDWALMHHVQRLRDDHARAQRLSQALQAIDGVRLVHPVQTNLVFFDPSGAGWSAASLAGALSDAGVRVSVVAGVLRAVTHLDAGDHEIDRAIEVMRELLSSDRRL